MQGLVRTHNSRTISQAFLPHHLYYLGNVRKTSKRDELIFFPGLPTLMHSHFTICLCKVREHVHFHLTKQQQHNLYYFYCLYVPLLSRKTSFWKAWVLNSLFNIYLAAKFLQIHALQELIPHISLCLFANIMPNRTEKTITNSNQ